MIDKVVKFEISDLWGKYDIVWDNINPDVNVLVGINGGGKSTLLKLMRDCIEIHSKSVLKKYFLSGCRATMSDGTVFTCGGDFGDNINPHKVNVEYINIFEPNIGRLRKDESILDHQLDRLLYQRDADTDNFTNYRLKASAGGDPAKVNSSIKHFFKTVNSLFLQTGKAIEIASNNIDIQFRDNNDNIIPLKFLSSGEKQVLIILLKVFLTENNPYIALLDEPETSLHIDWQYKFIDIIRDLNPNMQMIISTHSPGIFGDGWNDKIFYVEDFIVTKSATDDLSPIPKH